MHDDPATAPSIVDEQDRLAALAETGILDTPPDPRFDAITTLVATICEVPIALVSLVDADRQWFKSRVGADVSETPVATSVCALAIKQDALFQIEDLAADPRTCDFSLVTAPPHIRFYAGFPILGPRGLPLGSLCAIDVEPRPGGLTPGQMVALEALARQTALEIECGTAVRTGAAPSGGRAVGSWDWDVMTDRVTADASFAALYGVDPAVADRGAPIAEFMGSIHPDDRARVAGEIEQVLRNGDVFQSEYRIVQPDGRARWVLAQGQPVLSPDGMPLRFPGVSFDIDARKAAEQRLTALVELGDRLGAAGDARDLAFAAAETLGLTLGATRVGYGLIDAEAETIVTERDWCAPGITSYPGTLHFREYGSFIDELKQGDTVVIDDLARDPRTEDLAEAAKALSVEALVNLPLIEDGRFVALLFVNQDRPRSWTPEEVQFIREVAERTRLAVERRRAEREVAALNASLEAQVETRTRQLMVVEEKLRQAQKMEAVGQLTGGLAHDFNNLLTGISGAIEMMQVRIAQGRAGELGRYIEAAQGAAKRAAALTHRLLAFSRRQTLDPRPVDVPALITGLQDLVQRTVGPSVDIATRFAADAWTAMVDPNQLENAILNLCINARDAMPGGGTIRITTANVTLDRDAAHERDLEPGDYLAVSVADTGTGMTTEVRARAFDPFYTTKPIGQGTGLGLSMIYGFARQSGGRAWIDSTPGAGTTVALYLPRHEGRAEAIAGDAAAGLDGHDRAADARTVLVVDDEPTVRMLVVEVLEEMGHRPLEAEDGPTALRLLQSGARIDLLVTDVGLPGPMNGRQVADAAIALLPGLRVLFITGYAEQAVIGNRMLEANMGLMTKPFAMEALAAKVGELLA